MKKLLVFALMIMACNSLSAQVVLEDGNLKSVIEKAKAENKLVMVIGSATWCSPCKQFMKEVFSQKEAADYVNSKFIVKKYDVDLLENDDPDNINSFKVAGYPSFIILDQEGVEINRAVGRAVDVKSFIEKIEFALDPKNNPKLKYQRFLSDLDYACEYLGLLMSEEKYEEYANAVAYMFKNRSMAENFSPKNIEYFKNNCHFIDEPIIEYMIKNKEAVVGVIGNDTYRDIIMPLIDNYAAGIIYNDRGTLSDWKKEINHLKEIAVNKTAMVSFIDDVMKYIFAKEVIDAIRVANKYYKNAKESDRLNIVLAVTRNSMVASSLTPFDINRKVIIKFLDKCIKTEDSKENLEQYNSIKEYYVNHE